MRRFVIPALVATVLAAAATPASAGPGSRSLVFQLRFTGLVTTASWTTCPQPAIGDLCTDTIVFAFDSVTREGTGQDKIRDRGPVLRTLTFVYRFVGGEQGTIPVAEWFGRTEDATVEGTPRLTTATAEGTVPVLICSVMDPTAGVSCPDDLAVDLTWTGTGPRARIDDHTVIHMGVRTENTWTRGWQRTATVAGTVGGDPLGTLLGADLSRVDQGEVIVQHPLP